MKALNYENNTGQRYQAGVELTGTNAAPTPPAPTCSDGIQNGDETGIDCGGTVCQACETPATCSDGIQNGQETGVDCGGPDATLV